MTLFEAGVLAGMFILAVLTAVGWAFHFNCLEKIYFVLRDIRDDEKARP